MKSVRYISLLVLMAVALTGQSQDSIDTTSTVKQSTIEAAQEVAQDSTVKTKTDADEQNLLKNAADMANQAAETTLITGTKVIVAIVVIIITLLVVRLLKKLLQSFSERSTRHRITIKGFIPIVTIFFWMLAAYIIVVNVIAPPQSTLWAGLASVGLALGFAAQDILKNIFAGIVIIFDTPFKVGDKIEVGAHYGEVITIGLRSTKIVTPDDSMVTIPNGEVMNNSVSNANTGEAYCQVVSEVYLPPDIDTVKVRKLAIEAAQVSKYVYLNKPIVVLFFNEIHDGIPFYKMRLKAYVMDIRSEFAFKSDMTELVLRQLFAEGVLNENYYMNHGH